MEREHGLVKQIQKRYALESTTESNLGCMPTLEHAAVQPGESLLDLGCGRGTEAMTAARLVGPEGLVIGVDATPEMVYEAVLQAWDAGTDNAFFVEGDLEQLEFENASFDVVVSNCAINHASDKEQVFREMYRVLKFGGRFVISDPVSLESLPLEVKSDPLAWADCFGGAVTEPELIDCIEKAGFEKVTVLHRKDYVKNGYPFRSVTISGLKKGCPQGAET